MISYSIPKFHAALRGIDSEQEKREELALKYIAAGGKSGMGLHRILVKNFFILGTTQG